MRKIIVVLNKMHYSDEYKERIRIDCKHSYEKLKMEKADRCCIYPLLIDDFVKIHFKDDFVIEEEESCL